MPQPGRFNQYVRIERATRAQNALGEQKITDWTLVAELPAEVILPTPNAIDRAREAALAGAVRAERVVHFRLRDGADIDWNDRVVWNDEAYAVEGIVADPARGLVTITGRYVQGTDAR